ncbi:hypothetical protein [Marixanthomonas spongiae]|uniref:DUF4870 domain-containing protein n=1 Tax=Marixanthomonas spongiae TaxID=2174845 RepID=A0A2U0I3G9_9FLAO|nr:hypothetical protein [Marixanthomonas spongiae]PVW15638.1 hypothetical protein DDV96_05040 [Marixanthomonas spongiae]
MEPQPTTTPTPDNGKNVAIIAYITLIGWIIALVMHNNNKTDLGAFHLRQMLGLMLLGLALSVLNMLLDIYFLGVIIQLGMLVLWILGLVSAVQGEKKPIPLLGEQFQQWFAGIG